MKNAGMIGMMTGVAMLAAAGSASAQNAPIVKSGVGVRLTEHFNQFLESQLDNRDLSFDKSNIYKANISCFDEVGINNLHVDTHIDNAIFNWNGADSGLQASVTLAKLDLSGDLYGKDSQTFDLCPTFEINVNNIELDNLTLTLDLSPRADGSYNVYIDFNQPPQLDVGNVNINIDGFPNWLINLVTNTSFVHDFLIDQINQQLATQVPNMVKDAIITGMLTGQAGPFNYGIGATAIAIDDNGANALFDTQMYYAGPVPSCVPAGAPVPDFTVRGTPGLGEYGDNSQVEMSVADSAVNEVFWAVWSSGLLCYNSETHPLQAFDQVLQGISPEAGALLKYDIKISQPPVLRFDADQTTVTIKGFHLEADEVDPSGASKVLLLADADLSMGLKVDLDVATNRVLASLDGVSLNFDNLSSQILFSDRPNAEQDLKDFIKGYVVPRMLGTVQNMPVTNAVMPVQGYYVILDELHGREGHAVAGISVYAANDPSIDKIAPDTFLDTTPGEVSSTKVDLNYHGTDDRSGTLTYSWRLDGTTWSSWSEDTTASLVALTEGDHTFEVKARDRFQNEDASPATLTFHVAASGSKGALNSYLGCDVGNGATNGTLPAGAAVSLAAALAVGLVIRRRSAPQA